MFFLFIWFCAIWPLRIFHMITSSVYFPKKEYVVLYKHLNIKCLWDIIFLKPNVPWKTLWNVELYDLWKFLNSIVIRVTGTSKPLPFFYRIGSAALQTLSFLLLFLWRNWTLFALSVPLKNGKSFFSFVTLESIYNSSSLVKKKFLV